MKKIISFILIGCILLSLNSATFKYAPYDGFSGIPIGSRYYKGGSKWDYDNETNKTGQYGEGTYSDKEMLALITLADIDKAYYTRPFTISVSCPNGMYLTSLSNPEFKRPFKLYFYPVMSDKQRGVPFELSNASPVYQYYPSKDSAMPKSVSGNWSLWFDVVLYLPGEVDTSNDRLIDDDGTIYPLIKADDYSAIVTISIDHDGASAPMSMIIPFTGYYDGSATPLNNASLPVSLGVETYPEASNINLAVGNRGQWITVGRVNLLLNGSRKMAMFLSSSPSADVEGDAFIMVKDDLSYDAQLTSVNSIGFEVQMVDSSSGETKVFDGTAKVDYSKSIASLTDFVLLVGSVDPVDFSATHGSTKKSFRQYEGEIQVKLDRSDVTLLEGRYEGEIYIHVLVE